MKDTAKHLQQLRATIDWEPNIATDNRGKATICFYAADKPGAYTYIIEGTDGSGNLGYQTGKIVIHKP